MNIRLLFCIFSLLGVRISTAQTGNLRHDFLSMTPSFSPKPSLKTSNGFYMKGLRDMSWLDVHLIAGSSALFSGACDGMTQVLWAHYPTFDERYPEANQRYWNPDSSWVNKYENGDPMEGPKYFMSTTLLVSTTDGYHLFRALNKVSMVGTTSFVVSVNVLQNKRFLNYIFDAVFYSVCYGVGFHAIYTVHFKN